MRRLENVQTEVQRLRDILEDFLRFAGRYELDCRTVDLRQLVEDLSDFFEPQAESSHALLRTSLPDEPIYCELDEDLFKQAMLNLMINAVQAMPEGGELMIRVYAARRRACVQVTDTGRGIPEDELPKIFNVYYSTKKRGTGLGLPTTRRIIEEHGGTLKVESEVGKGTSFTISLPLARE